MRRRKQLVELQRLATLHGQRLLLRQPQPDDSAAVYAYASDAEVTRFLAWPCHTSQSDSDDFLHMAREGWQGGRHLVWLIEDESGVVGSIGAEMSNPNAGIGYVLARQRWGRGYATEALGLVVQALSRYTPVETIWAMCVAENFASKRVLEKCGFHYARALDNYFSCPNLGGEMKDVYLYSLQLSESG